MTRDVKKIEAIKRMRLLNLHPNTIKEFEESDVVNMSEGELASLFWVSDKEKEIIKSFEEKYNGVVYHVIRTHTVIGEMLSLMYVSDSEEEWESDREDITDGYAFVYVKNVDDDWCSEFGSICIKSMYGGLVRTA